MKLLLIVAKSGNNLGSALKNKELELRGKGTTFYLEKKGKWKHTRFAGWINLIQTKGEVCVAKVQTKKEGAEWQLLSAFIGYLDRHFEDIINSISIYYE